MPIFGFWSPRPHPDQQSSFERLVTQTGHQQVLHGRGWGIAADAAAADRGWGVRQILHGDRVVGVVSGNIIVRANGDGSDPPAMLRLSEVTAPGTSAPWGQYGAAAVLDAGARLLLTVDPLAITELYFVRHRGSYLFADGMAELCAMLGEVPEIDWSQLAMTLHRGTDMTAVSPVRRTPFLGVDRVGVGGVLTFSAAGIEPTQRWHPAWFIGESNDPIDPGLLREQLRRCVAAWTRHCPQVAVSLSGGLDSSAVTWAAAATGTLTAAVHRNTAAVGSTSSEAEYARLVADRFGVELTELLEPQPLDASTQTSAGNSGQRYPAYPVTPTLMHAVHEAGLDAAGTAALLTGEGGDHLFYSWAYPHHVHDLWLDGRFREGFTQLYDASYLRGQPLLDGLRDVARSEWARRAGAARLYASFRHEPVTAGWFLREALRGAEPPAPRRDSGSRPRFGAGRAQHLLSIVGMPDQVNAMMNEYPGRYIHAMLAPPLIESVLAAPMRQLVDPDRDRPLLREAMTGQLPAEIVFRQGKGEYTGQWSAGLRRNYDYARQLLEQSRLAERGLIERTGAVAALSAAAAGETTATTAVLDVVLIEHWLRTWRQHAAVLSA